MPPVLDVLNISTIDPDRPGWERWIDASRLAAASRFRLKDDRARCIGAGLLLAHAVRRIDPACTLPPRPSRGANGKPFLPDLPHFHFSLAHSGKWAVCAVADHPVGVDIEPLPSMADVVDVARRCFTQIELRHLFSLPESDRPSAFCTLWTIKESYMKATGLGFQIAPQELEIRLGPPITLHRNGIPVPCQLAIPSSPEPDYHIALTQLSDMPPRKRKDAIDMNNISLTKLINHLN
ncbi:MAG: 4'-phosphopantetheinyl transferase superfamily protein [Desulfobulbus sp.]